MTVVCVMVPGGLCARYGKNITIVLTVPQQSQNALGELSGRRCVRGVRTVCSFAFYEPGAQQRGSQRSVFSYYFASCTVPVLASSAHVEVVRHAHAEDITIAPPVPQLSQNVQGTLERWSAMHTLRMSLPPCLSQNIQRALSGGRRYVTVWLAGG